MPHGFFEHEFERACVDWFKDLGYKYLPGVALDPEEGPERLTFEDVVLKGRLEAALLKINPTLKPQAIDEALRELFRTRSPSAIMNNRSFHRMLRDGIEIEIRTRPGIRGEVVNLIDYENPQSNDFLLVNQLWIKERSWRRPDIIAFVNGLPLAVVELKNPADEEEDVWTAYRQLQTYQAEIPSLFVFSELLVISDGASARLGTLTLDRERFLPWRTVEGEELAPITMSQPETLIRGVFDKARLLELLRFFVAFEDDGARITKKVAGYHQFHATRTALETTVDAAKPGGDRRGGVVWHTQGSGKSLTMVFFAGQLVRHPALANPTIVVLSDRIDLDGQLFGVFAACEDILRQAPVQAESRADLREKLAVASGGIVFTTIQKFFPDEKGDTHPTLSERSNIIVLADEAHRSQYDFIDGFARHMRDALPNATFVGFTGTPIDLRDRSTRAVFGDYISIYDIKRAVEDGATVPIFYQSRLVQLDLPEELLPKIDEDFEEVTEGEEVARVHKLKSKWAALEAVVGTERRLEMVAKDLIEHFEERLTGLYGKAMVVCMSRRICVDLYNHIIMLRPEWHAEEDNEGALKVVMTGSASDPTEWQQHIRSKARREALARRFKNPDDPFNVVIVRDMWLTGFDAPSLHTMYLDKPMRGHNLMQAIARVNRVFSDKPGGLVVDYLGLADSLRKAAIVYTESGGKGHAAIDQDAAVSVLHERYEVCKAMFHGFDYSTYPSGTAAERLSLLPSAQEHILAQKEGKQRFVAAVNELAKAFALAAGRPEAAAIRDEVAFFQTVKAYLVKTARVDSRTEEELDHAIQQIVSSAIAPDQVIDIFQAAGLSTPDISVLSDEFLDEVRHMPQKNLAAEFLAKLIENEVRQRAQTNLVQSRSFADKLAETVRRYQNRAVEAAQVIEELIALAKEMRRAEERGHDLGLSEEEAAFYDALETNDSAVQVLGDETLRTIAIELTRIVRKNATIDWTLKQSVRAKLRTLVRRVLRKYGYPPDKQERATLLVLEQAQLLGWEVAAEREEPAQEEPASAQPFTVLSEDVRPFKNCIPLYSLSAAAGAFSETQTVDGRQAAAWVRPHGRIRPGEGLFLAQVVGESMNRVIPNGAYCVFRTPVTGSRQGRIVLVQHREIADPDQGGHYTVKRYESVKEADEEGGWRHKEIILIPETYEIDYEPMVLRDTGDNDIQVIAEVIEVLG